MNQEKQVYIKSKHTEKNHSVSKKNARAAFLREHNTPEHFTFVSKTQIRRLKAKIAKHQRQFHRIKKQQARIEAVKKKTNAN